MLNENHEIHSSSLILIFAASAISQNFSLVPHWRPPKLPKKLEYIFTVLKNHQKCLIWKLLKTSTASKIFDFLAPKFKVTHVWLSAAQVNGSFYPSMKSFTLLKYIFWRHCITRISTTWCDIFELGYRGRYTTCSTSDLGIIRQVRQITELLCHYYFQYLVIL